MNTLYLEVIASIVAAAVLGLLVGWFIRDVRAKRRLKATIAHWKKKSSEQAETHAVEVEELESRLQSVGEDVRELTAANRQLKSVSARNDAGVDKARSDAIELNRKQAELQDRLQRIIRQKDREISELQNQSSRGSVAMRSAGKTHDNLESAPAEEEVEAYIDSLAHRGNRLRDEAQSLVSSERSSKHPAAGIAAGATAAAAAIGTGHVLADANDAQEDTLDHDATIEDTLDESYDATAVIDAQAPTRAAGGTPSDFDDTLPELDDELDATEVADYDEATVALDDEVLAQVRSRPRSTSGNPD